MKKLILFGIALLFSLDYANAQGWQTTGAHDDFATATVYKNGANLEGLIWFEDGTGAYTLTRPGTGAMTVAASAAGGCNNGGPKCYALFGVNFNDSNDNGTGTPFTVNLSGGANVQIDVENTSSQLMYMGITLEDINGVQAKIEPNISDVTASWADPQRKALNGFTLAAGARQTITIDLSSVPGAIGGLTTGAYTCSGPSDCPVTTYSIDPSQIEVILFQVNFGFDNIDLSEGDGDHTVETFIQGSTIVAFTGDILVHDFKIGSTITGVNEAVIDNSLSVYPNPADEALTVSFEAAGGADVSLTDIIGTKVFSTSASAGENNITVNTSGLSSGIYILNIATENGMVARKVNIK